VVCTYHARPGTREHRGAVDISPKGREYLVRDLRTSQNRRVGIDLDAGVSIAIIDWRHEAIPKNGFNVGWILNQWNRV